MIYEDCAETENIKTECRNWQRGGEMIDVRNVTKQFGRVIRVKDVSFHVERGEIFGLLGPNGAGKTTIIRMLTGEIRPTEGAVYINGINVVENRSDAVRQMGVVFEQQNLYDRISVNENLRLFANLYNVSYNRVDELIERFRLKEQRRQRVRELSQGQKQKVVLARALLNAPHILFLDEPTRGLDPQSAAEFRDTIREINAQGTVIFLTTHYMEEADQLCCRVAIIDDGKIVALDRPATLKEKYSSGKVKIIVNNGQGRETVIIPLNEVTHALSQMSAGNIVSIGTLEPSLEEVFIRLTGRTLQ